MSCKNITSSYGHHQKRPPSRRRRRMENCRSDGTGAKMTSSSSHENCSCFVSNSPGSSSRHFDNTLKVLEKKSKFLRKTFSLSSICEEPPIDPLDLEFDIAERLRELRESHAISLSKLNEISDEDDGIIYFMSRDRSGTTNLKMRFVNSLSNLSTLIRNGINKINDNGKF